jgi:hypothetical chaperone protein
MTNACGIDFGTSNSTVAVARAGETVLVPVEGADTTIPSAIFYPAGGEAPLYGRAAVRAYSAREPGRLMRSLKSILGSDLVTGRTAVGGRYETFEGILVGFIRYLRAKAEAFTGSRIEDVVMGRPVHFVDANPDADRRAETKLGEIARAAGFRNVSFAYEPIAAALSYEHGLTRDEVVLVADVGGGTADFSIVEVGPRRRGTRDRSGDILANDGVRVGGTNLDMRLSLTAVMPHLGSRSRTRAGHELPRWPFLDLATWYRIHEIASERNLMTFRQLHAECAEPEVFKRYLDVLRRESGHLIAGRVEQAKIELSARDDVSIDLSEVVPGLSVGTSRDDFETAIETEIERLQETVSATIRAAGRPASLITSVFLTGGSSAVPAVRRAVTGQTPAASVIEGDLFNSVGFGLALEAARRTVRMPA